MNFNSLTMKETTGNQLLDVFNVYKIFLISLHFIDDICNLCLLSF